jgi:hypothetical protein
LAAIFSRKDLIFKKKGQMPIAKLKYLVANGDLATGNFAPYIIQFPFKLDASALCQGYSFQGRYVFKAKR